MKVKRDKKNRVPITLETETEKSVFGNLLNCAPVNDAIKIAFKQGFQPSLYWDAFLAAGCNIHSHTKALADGLLHSGYFRLRHRIEKGGEE
jgi:hypothetical protein